MWHSRPPQDPPPFMANAILNFHFDYLNPSLSVVAARAVFSCVAQIRYWVTYNCLKIKNIVYVLICNLPLCTAQVHQNT